MSCGTVVLITFKGQVPPGERSEFHDWQVCTTGEATVLIARDVDQALLHGTLDRLALLGLHVVELSRRPTL